MLVRTREYISSGRALLGGSLGIHIQVRTQRKLSEPSKTSQASLIIAESGWSQPLNILVTCTAKLLSTVGRDRTIACRSSLCQKHAASDWLRSPYFGDGLLSNFAEVLVLPWNGTKCGKLAAAQLTNRLEKEGNGTLTHRDRLIVGRPRGSGFVQSKDIPGDGDTEVRRIRHLQLGEILFREPEAAAH